MKTNNAIFGLIIVAASAVLLTLIGAQPNPGGVQSQTQQLGGTWSYTVDVTGVPLGFPLGYKSLITFDSAGGNRRFNAADNSSAAGADALK